MLTLTIDAVGLSLFQESLDLASIGDEAWLASIINDVPMVFDEQPKPEKKDKGGGERRRRA